MIIRKATEKDAESIHLIEEMCFADPWSTASVLEDIKRQERSFYLVAEEEDQILGYVGVWNILGEGHITNVAVRPEARRKHIADQLIDELTKAFEVATLEVRAGNEAAIRLYEKHGFIRIGLRKGYYENNGEDAIIMWRGYEDEQR
ncbi:MAG: ribosomal protein S18-alanine N-acetyltransferase [Clostridia bacterium]|nr:ribosomal protein S18-alanine N-acetyltransferase [Clostridia bacterium]